MKTKTRILVTGAGGFIGHHLVKRLKAEGHWVRGVDIKQPEYEPSAADEFELLDLRHWHNALLATRQVDQVYNLAADMGGIGYITAKLAEIARNNLLINAHMLEASRVNGVARFLFSSSACVYAGYKQDSPDVAPLREEDAHPADPEPGYGWEKLFTEQLCRYFRHDYGLRNPRCPLPQRLRPARHLRRRQGESPGRHLAARSLLPPTAATSKSGATASRPAPSCGSTTASKASCASWPATTTPPLNLGTEELVTIDQLVDMTCHIAGKRLHKVHALEKPQGVRGRNSDNSRLRVVLGWEPQTPLAHGLDITYRWIEQELERAGRLTPELAYA